ncbi:hypothetical protein [Fusobacterium polymorphum]|uniref:hypothetical protein n=1 Tax=Fusobacterium nucleatum subsp. polymorphum TaxID=76857 RepID=UPI003008E23B
MSEFINKKEIIDMIDSLYNSFSYTDYSFFVQTFKGTFVEFELKRREKINLEYYYNNFKSLINNDIINYEVFHYIYYFLYSLSEMLKTRIVLVEDKYINGKKIQSIKQYYQKNPINFYVNFPKLVKENIGQIITSNIIESLKEHYNRFKNLDWGNVPNIRIMIERNLHTL